VGVSAAWDTGGALSLDGIPDALPGVGGTTVKGKHECECGAIILKDMDDGIGKHDWVML
jgi:hypothetical protein